MVGVNALYACVGICTKMASQQEMMSWPYMLWFEGAVGIIGVYAILWQQILRRVDVSLAFMFKGTTLVFSMCIAAWLFGEPITIPNIIGSAIIITGIVLLSRS